MWMGVERGFKHDDVEDESEQRRHQPTLHTLHGAPIAVNLGDALALLSLRALMDNCAALGLRVTMRVLEEAERMAREAIEGQAIELGWRRHNTLGDDADLDMVPKKTCWYATIYPSRIGALIATREEHLDRFIPFRFFLGAAFQNQDDILNLIEDARHYGKEPSGDIWEGKRTLMLKYLVGRLRDGERARLREFLARPRPQRASLDVGWVREGMMKNGSIEYARQAAHGLAGAARHEFERIYSDVQDSRDRRSIEALLAWVLAGN